MTLSSVNRLTKRTLSLPLPLFVTAATCAVVLVVVVVVALVTATGFDSILTEPTRTTVDAQSTTYNSTRNTDPHRKLLHHHHHNHHHHHHAKALEPDRFWGDTCSTSDIVVNQGLTEPLSNGIPTYSVEIMNVCSSGCDISGIHLSCGWFGSARLINPRLFKRIAYDDCLVNDGKPLLNGHTVSFQYANTYSYKLAVTSVIC